MHPANRWLIGLATATLVSGAALWEGYAPVAYRDIGGVATYCYGETEKVIWGKRYTEAECKLLLATRLKGYGAKVLECITVPIREHEYNAYTLFAYNVGVRGFCNSRANRLLSEGKHEEACKALATGPNGKPAWSYVNGKYVQGLQNRRQFEVKWCLNING